MIRVLIGLLLLSLSSGAYAELYSYVDEDGVLHFTNLSQAEHRRRRMERHREQQGAEGFGGQKPVVIEVDGRERMIYPVNVTRFDELFRKAAEHYRLPFALVKAVAKVESNFDPTAVSPANAKGLMQLIDSTAAQMKVRDAFNPEQNIFGGARYLRYLANAFEGDLVRVTAAYNAGPVRVNRAGGIPKITETQRYVKRVLQMYRHYRLQESTRP